MKALRCPQCGADLELDDSKEFGFCSSCGTKIELNETLELKHSGSVQMKPDNSDQGHDWIALGNQAFDGGNYQEAYDCFTKGLEDVPDDITALYRKGICAIFLSSNDSLRTAELSAGIASAAELINARYSQAGDDAGKLEQVRKLSAQYDSDMEYLVTTVRRRFDNYFNQLTNVQKCNYQAATWAEGAKLFEIAIGSISNEEIVERLLPSAINQCDSWLSLDSKKEITYYTHTTTNKKGKSKDHYSVYRMDNSRVKVITDARNQMADQFNNLNSRLERTQHLEEQAQKLNENLRALQKESDKLKKLKDAARKKCKEAEKAFWDSHPDYASRRKSLKNKSWISVGVGAVVVLISFLFRSKTIFAPIAGVIIFLGSFFVRSKIASGAVSKLEDELFPSEIKGLRSAFEEAERNWSNKENERREKESELSAKRNEISAFKSTNK